MKAIYKRELKSYFDSMIGYVFIAFLVAITGIYFMVYNLNMGYPYFSYALNSILFIMLVAVPVLTMKCFAEEKKSRTDQLLLTAPVSLSQIVLGKYFAMVTVFAVPCAIYAVFPLIIESQGEAHIGIDYMAILAFSFWDVSILQLECFYLRSQRARSLLQSAHLGYFSFCICGKDLLTSCRRRRWEV